MNNQEKILISVIIPSYNRANTVGETIESIMAQEGIGTDYDLEIIIGDDCSTDNARDVLLQYKEKYPEYIQLIFHEHNMRLGSNYAICALACKGKYICNCDNDDYWHNPKKLLLQLDYMEKHPQSNVLFTDYRDQYRDTGRTIERKSYINRKRPIQDVVWGDRKSNYSNATVMYRADFLKQHVNFKEWIDWHFTLQDWNLWVIIAAYTDFDILHVSTATMCIENESITRPKNVENLATRYQGDKEVCRYLGMLFPDKFHYDESDWEAYAQGRLVAKAFDMHDYKKVQECIAKPYTGISKVKDYCAHHEWAFNWFCALRAVYRALKEKKKDVQTSLKKLFSNSH